MDIVSANQTPISEVTPKPHNPMSAALSLHSSETETITARQQRTRFKVVLSRMVNYWPWIIVASLTLGFEGFLLGYWLTGYQAKATLLVAPPAIFYAPGDDRFLANHSEGYFNSLIDALRSENMLRQVAALSANRLDVAALRVHSQITFKPDDQLMCLSVTCSRPRYSMALVNLYADRALDTIRAIWLQDLQAFRHACDIQIGTLDQEIAAVQQQLVTLQPTNAFFSFNEESVEGLKHRMEADAKAQMLQTQIEALEVRLGALTEELRQQNPALLSLRESLQQALQRYTEEHPRVKALRAGLAQMEADAKQARVKSSNFLLASTNLINHPLALQVVELRAQKLGLQKEFETLQRLSSRWQHRLLELSDKAPAHAKLEAEYRNLLERRNVLTKQRQDILVQENQGNTLNRIQSQSRLETISAAPKWHGGFLAGIASGISGAVLIVVVIFLIERGDRKIQSAEEFQRSFGLPVVAKLGDLSGMNEQAKEAWALRALEILKSMLRCKGNNALICGFASSGHGEGKTTCMNLLADTAHKKGYCVLTISAEALNQSKCMQSSAHDQIIPAFPTPGLTSRAHFPITDRAWDLQFRGQLNHAITTWSQLENVALFVEIPPYSTPEGILLASQVPNVFWICGQDMADASETAEHLETLRQTQRNVAGAFINQPNRTLRKKCVVGAVLLLCLLITPSAPIQAQTPNPGKSPLPISSQQIPPPSTIAQVQPVATSNMAPAALKEKGALSIVSPDKLADWQRHLTLGPGDVLDISLYGQTNTVKTGQAIGPDGRLNFLQARDFMAAGFTVDELRSELEKVLSKYYLAPQVIIYPMAYHSKKFYLLGNVIGKGVYTLDRPLTLVEAITRGGGFPINVQRQNVTLMVDLPRSFLMRKDSDGAFARVPVDFEALFLQGDLAQNVALAPEDYLFFPDSGPQEVYVLGEVRGPGIVPFARDLTALGAVLSVGGFTPAAWKGKILIVRGSLTKPQTLIVNASEILRARGKDMRLANRDIVYVHKKPWSKAEDLLDLAITAFSNAAVLGWTGQHVGPFIKAPIF